MDGAASSPGYVTRYPELHVLARRPEPRKYGCPNLNYDLLCCDFPRGFLRVLLLRFVPSPGPLVTTRTPDLFFNQTSTRPLLLLLLPSPNHQP